MMFTTSTTTQRKPQHCFKLFILAGASMLIAATQSIAGTVSVGEGTRPWLGPNVWPNPMQDWSVDEGTIVAVAGQDRTAHALGYWVSAEALAEPVEATVTLELAAGTTGAGFRLGIHTLLMDHRAALFAHGAGIDAAIDARGTLRLAAEEVATELTPLQGPVILQLTATPADAGETLVRLTATDQAGRQASLEQRIPTDTLVGNLALLAESNFKGPTKADSTARRPRVRFNAWTLHGERLTHDLSATLGPILWSQYTLSNHVLTVSAQMPPLGEHDTRSVGLEVIDPSSDTGWRELARSDFDDDARVAVFRLTDWTHDNPTPARLTYLWQGQQHTWPITIRPEPAADQPITIAVMNCDAGYAFPQTPLVQQVLHQNPDLLFFAGDQIYEHIGGFGVGRDEPVDFAILDYLRKYIMFGWTWREALRDRPSVIVPDDHDVFHGNVWGAGGRLLQPDERLIDGGYLMPVCFVNAVQRTQTAHLPPPHDPTPTDSGIGVYYTTYQLGPVDLAILEDRKWKDGPGTIQGPMYDRANLKDAELLGTRQEAFLTQWMQRPALFKVVLSQSMFAKPATHAGWKLKPQPQDPDSNGWPMPARDRALRILGPDVVMLAGDQHLGMLARMGIDTYDDGPLVLMAPGTANGHPRAWWPETTADGQPAADRNYTGHYLDGLGNRLTVLGVANPQPGSSELRPDTTHPYELARLRGSGYGLATFSPANGQIEFSLSRFPAHDDAPIADRPDPFPGLPLTLP